MINSIFPILGVMVVVGLVPLFAVICTAFTKIVVVLMIARNALGIQQTPPNLIVFSLAMVLSVSVMSDVVERSLQQVPTTNLTEISPSELLRVGERAAEPFRKFMLDNSLESSREVFASIARKRQPAGTESATIDPTRYSIVIPAFVMDELTRAFRIGFMIYLPFLIIDLVASAILVAIGMQMVSVTMITTPLKILLFVEAQGWERLMEFLLLSYR